MHFFTIRQAQANLRKLVDYATEAHKPVYIIGKHHKAVLLGEEDYRGLLETLHIISLPNMRESLLSARDTPLTEFTEHIPKQHEDPGF
jgi:antitoxin YefM